MCQIPEERGVKELDKAQNLILDFTHVYPEDIESKVQDIRRIDLSDIRGTNMYCTAEAKREIRKRLTSYGPGGIHFLDNGNYHYVTKLFAEKIRVPFSLVLFDYHDDMQQPMIHELTSCGSWAGEMLSDNPCLKQLILIGPNKESIRGIPEKFKEKLVCVSMQEIEAQTIEKDLNQIQKELPAYISIDKDVLDRYGARTNWNQGSMSVDTLQKLLSEVFRHQKVIGVDICGECSLEEPFSQLIEDEKVNGTTNAILYHFLSKYFSDKYKY